MNILVLMLQSIRSDQDHGGSSKHVSALAAHLVSRGHHVRILCARAADNAKPYQTSEGVTVLPVLPFRDSWVDTWYVPPFHLALIVSLVREQAETADRVVVFDSHFLYPDVFPQNVPVIWSLRDYTYLHALLGSTAFRRDVIVTPSHYIGRALRDAMSGLLPEIATRITVIPNGVEIPPESKQSPPQIDGPVLLFPHRPEPEKGFTTALDICRRLVERGFTTTTLRVPYGVDATTRPEVMSFYHKLHDEVVSLGLAQHVQMEHWGDRTEMLERYATSHATLCVGSIVEACSNSALESLAHHRPVYAFKIACYREFSGVTTFAVGAVEDLVDRIASDYVSGYRVDWSRSDQDLLRTHHAVDQLDAFAQVIETAEVLPCLRIARTAPSLVRFPIWVTNYEETFYNEYTRATLRSDLLAALWCCHKREPFVWDGPIEVRHDLIEQGYLSAAHPGG